MESESASKGMSPQHVETNPGLVATSDADPNAPLNDRISALERSLLRLRLTTYCLVSVLLIAGVLAGQWLFKQFVNRVDDLSGSLQIQIDRRTQGIRLNIEDQLKGLRQGPKAARGADASLDN